MGSSASGQELNLVDNDTGQRAAGEFDTVSRSVALELQYALRL